MPHITHYSPHPGPLPWWGWVYIALVGGCAVFSFGILIWRRLRAWLKPDVAVNQEATTEEDADQDTQSVESSTDDIYDSVVGTGRKRRALRRN